MVGRAAGATPEAEEGRRQANASFWAREGPGVSDVHGRVPARLLDLGPTPYARAWPLMRGLVRARRAGAIPEVVMLVEHEDVVTLGRRGGEADLRVSREELAARGVRVYQVERGGLATCHGPGQLVAYLVLDLPGLGLGVAEAVRRLEQAAIATLAGFGVAAERREGNPGVWVGPEKIASLGLAVQGGVTSHGLALNHARVPAPFDLVLPCGMNEPRLTCLSRLLGAAVDEARLRAGLAGHLAAQFGLELSPWSLAEAEGAAGRTGEAP
jgi:lipoate-protein ligase B